MAHCWPQLPPEGQRLPKATAPLAEQALKLLGQIMAEVQTLKLPENRIRLQLAAGDLLWEHDEERARSLFIGGSGWHIDQSSAGTMKSAPAHCL